MKERYNCPWWYPFLATDLWSAKCASATCQDVWHEHDSEFGTAAAAACVGRSTWRINMRGVKSAAA
jgi:hypothetical protein